MVVVEALDADWKPPDNTVDTFPYILEENFCSILSQRTYLFLFQMNS